MPLIIPLTSDVTENIEEVKKDTYVVSLALPK